MTNPHNRLLDLTEFQPMVTMSGFSKWRSRQGNRQLSKTRARAQNPWQTETKTGSRHMCAAPPSTQNTALSCAFVVTGDFDIDERALCCLHQRQVKQVDFASSFFYQVHTFTMTILRYFFFPKKNILKVLIVLQFHKFISALLITTLQV